MVDDDALTRAAGNCGESYRAWVEGVGRPWRSWDDLVVADMGIPITTPLNHATLRVPLPEGRVEDVIDRLHGFFDGAAGGGYEVWSLWPTPNLSRFGFEPWSVPMMIRPAGGEARPAPPELEIVEVDDAAAAREVQPLYAAFDLPPTYEGPLLTPSLLGETFRVWLGRVDGRPVSTAATSVSQGYVGIYGVATDPAARGRGYGEALTWAATLSRPELPATLQSSAMGRGVYERMGFEVVASFHCWDGVRG